MTAGPITLLLIALVLSATGARVAGAQTTSRQDSARFHAALEAFEADRFAEAAEAFKTIANSGGAYSTAAEVFEFKSAYRSGRYADAVDGLDRFLSNHPESRYARDARRTRGLAAEALNRLARRPRTIGIILSLSSTEAPQSQAVFNGIRMAVDDFNRDARPSDQVRMVFEEIGNDPRDAGRAVRSVVDKGAVVVVGALFSDQAREAAASAESAGVVFLAPLATDVRVSRGRRLAFQANPTFEMRGRLMARFAVGGLLLKRFGAISTRGEDDVAESMAESFLDEVEKLGGEVVFHRRLASNTDWFRAESIPSRDSLASIRGLYVPLSGNRPERLAGALLSGLERAGASVRVLGNAEWRDLPIPAQAGKFSVTYTSDYFADPANAEVSAFGSRYRTAMGTTPGRLAHVGFDVARFVLEAIDRSGIAADDDRAAVLLANAIRSAPPFDGVGIRIDFRGGQVNEAMFYHRYRDARLELLR